MALKDTKFQSLFDNLSTVWATGWKTAFVQDFRHCILTVTWQNTSVGTLEVLASTEEDLPDFTAAASETNIYDTVQVVDLEDGTDIPWDTWLAFTADDQRNFEVNINAFNWIAVRIKARTTGDFTAKMQITNNV